MSRPESLFSNDSQVRNNGRLKPNAGQRRWALCVFLFISLFNLKGQDIQYSQYFANPLYLNPAFTGAIPNHRLTVNHRIQWPELPKAFTNYSVSYDYNAENLNSGFGLLINADRAGSANLRYTSAAFNYSYTVNFNRKLIFKPGLSFGYVTRNVDYDKLVFGDQIQFGIDGAPSQDPSIGEIEATSYFDVGSGFILYNETYWGGMSAFHINEPNNSIIGGENHLPMKMTIHGGAKFEVGNAAFKDIKKVNIAPSFIYKWQGDFQQLDVGASFHYEPVIFGLWYRGMPFQESVVPDMINHDAVIMLFGVEFSNFQFGYSYDTNISRLSSDTGGAHEFSLQYFFDIRDNPNKVKKSMKYLPCPAFMGKLLN